MSIIKGALYVVATPLGNLGDMSPRAVQALSDADLIAAEDTRHSAPLLRHFGIRTPCVAMHEHNERQISPRLLARLRSGQSIAMISDAGTPGIRDPGSRLVRAAHKEGVRVIPVPGPSALISALSISGLPGERFVFEGFLPSRTAARRRRLESLRDEARTLIFYEAPHLIIESLHDIMDILGGDRDAVLARELTKVFETIHCAALADLLSWIQADTDQQRGEIVILVKGCEIPAAAKGNAEQERVLAVLLSELPLKQAVSVGARIMGVKRNLLYERALKMKQVST